MNSFNEKWSLVMIKKLQFAFILFLFINTIQAQPTNFVVEKQKSHSFLQQIEDWYKVNTNYFSITVLMTCESSIFPIPSEIVIPPAVYIAMGPESNLNILLIIIFGTIGTIIGASFNYWLSFWLGRIVLLKFADSKAGKILLISSEKIKKAEKFFNDHGKAATFFGRIIPVIRQFIPIPAGLARMNYFSFLLYTTLGAIIWNFILALMGYLAYGQQYNINIFSENLSNFFFWTGVLLQACIIYKILTI